MEGSQRPGNDGQVIGVSTSSVTMLTHDSTLPVLQGTLLSCVVMARVHRHHQSL